MMFLQIEIMDQDVRCCGAKNQQKQSVQVFSFKTPNLVQTSTPKEHQSCSTRDHEILLEIQFSVEKVDF